VLPQGEAGARVTPAEAGNGAYELVIDPVPYDPDARAIRVDVRAWAAREDGSPVEITGPSATIGLCPPDDLAELEGIGEKVQEFLYRQGILTFKQLAGPEVDVKTINAGLDAAGWKMMDAKTWPQQAKLAAIAREFGMEEDRLNYEAYKAWLKDGIEPDDYDRDEMSRRPLPALPWNGIPQFTPLVLSLALSPSNGHRDQSITLPVQLNNAEDPVRLETVDWEASAQVLPGGEQAAVTVEPIDPQKGRYEIVIAPPAREAKEIRLRVQACVNGRSVEIFYGKAITVHVSPPPAANELSDLEGIEAATEKILNEKGIFTFKQLAAADHRTINKWLDDAGQKMRDAKTWPQQARLADLARKFGSEEDQRSYQAYKSWLKAGIEPDEYDLDENARRAEALVWHGTAELTENAYPAIFRRS
jgi:predicted flap endonuclease-1-like 5' DNA nuclease